ncbi:MAG TPA: hypothetical protein VFE30_12005 [Anaeromyxobacteraceae bacterium]|jgi:hypothetical protein|nr:hypothetical protein [Anaeromyxobacteraceae bacterium]
MSKRLVIIGVMSLAACGLGAQQEATSPSSPSSPTTTIGKGSGVSISASALTSVSATAKVVVSQSTPTETLVDAGLETATPACTTDSDCSAFTGAACSAKLHLCTVTTYAKTRFYIQNQAPDATTHNVSIPVPCDGRSYSVEVYGADSSTPPVIKEIWTADGIAIPSTACVAPATVPWVDRTAAATSLLPAYSIPAIYDASVPNHPTFTIGVQNLGYPWATSTGTWNVTYGAPAVTGTRSSGSVTFNAPAAGTTSISLDGSFRLDGSLTVGTESPWQYSIPATTATVYTSAGIAL